MDILTADVESYYDDTYGLGRGKGQHTTEHYVRSPKFEAHGWGLAMNGQRLGWFRPDAFRAYCATVDWSKTGTLAHHAHFDGLVATHHFGIRPAMWFCTLSMGRLLVGNHLSNSLESLAEHFGLGQKNIDYEGFKGLHWDEMPPHTQRNLSEGCCNDVQLTWDLFCRLAQSFPQEEYALVDATVRMFTDPVLVGNTALLADIWKKEAEDKAALLKELGVDGAHLRSNEKFAELLRAEGVEPETKPGKNGPIYAFAQTDDFMRDLLDDEDDRVATLAEARLSEKSNGVQTRTERLGYMSTRGAMPVYLNYCGAHTTRWSGGDKVNWQNFKRGGPLAGAIEAPEGHMIVVNDASQIECRLLNMVAGQHDVIERFRNKEDPYVEIASKFYGFKVTKAHQAERGTGKQLELSCGYGAGAQTIKVTAKKGTYGPPVLLTDEQALQARDLYRETHPAICAQNSGYWAQAGRVISRLAGGAPMDWGPLHIANNRIWLPNDAPILYDTLEHHTDEESQDKYWRVRTRKHGWSKLYGAKLVENVIQALARVHVSQAWLRCRAAGIHMVSMEHDKLIAVVREHEAQDAFDYMKVEMCRAPDWLPGIPLDSEGYISRTFGKPE